LEIIVSSLDTMYATNNANNHIEVYRIIYLK